jgi:hypothetical protein
LLLTRSVSISMLLAAHIGLQSSVFCTMFTTMYLMVCIFVLILPNPCFVYICRGKIIKISAFVLLLNSTGPKNQYLRRNWPSPKMAQTGYTFAPNSPKVQSMPGTAQQILAPWLKICRMSTLCDCIVFIRHSFSSQENLAVSEKTSNFFYMKNKQLLNI